MNRTIVVIPTLNEYENVKILLSKFVDVDVDVIFIDDNSTDLTDQIIKNDINVLVTVPSFINQIKNSTSEKNTSL